MSRLFVLLVLIAFQQLVQADFHGRVCDLPYCECTAATHPSWTTVNCSLPRDERLDIMEGDLPETTTDLIITGGEALMFGSNSLSELKDARHFRLSGPKIILMRKHAAMNLNVVSVYLEIDNCDVLRIEERTFRNIGGPLSVTIQDCGDVSLEGMTFSWLLTMSISNVQRLQLGKGTFVLDPSAANVDEHGPGMTIKLKNLSIPEIPGETFRSSAAEIIMESVDVQVIRTHAFSANTYNGITAINCSFNAIEGESFAQKSLILHLQFNGCKIHQLASKALQSAMANLDISNTMFENVEPGAINATVASVVIMDSKFKTFKERGFELSSPNKLHMIRNTFDELVSHAITAPAATIHELVFVENEIETMNPSSLGFIGQTQDVSPHSIKYKDNYYGQPCHCNISIWLRNAFDAPSSEIYESESYCTVDEFFARCFNVPEQNMLFKKFLDEVCLKSIPEMTIQCEPYKSKAVIKNPRFPHEGKEEGISERDKKVIGIVIVTALGCVVIVMFISLIRWMRRKGYCVNVKNILSSSNSSCGSFCDRLCSCGINSGLDNARSISQLSVNEYSERHRLNEPRVQDTIQETTIPNLYAEQVVPTDDKTTQTLPEELTKELLENLKEKLEDPENYVEAREMIEHLYELIKVEESCNTNTPNLLNAAENIYELPYQNTTPRIGKNKKQMISVGTRTPSLDKLMPLSPYNRQTALAHEYFEPKDFAVHLYAEIANCDKEKKTLLGTIPDVVAEQAVPRGPYLRAVREKMNSYAGVNPSKSIGVSLTSPQHGATIKSNKSTASNSSGKMMNRPLPEKPGVLDPGEGTSFKHG